jgi:peptidoglycan/LPS O-acetylase OafA/YrhL
MSTQLAAEPVIGERTAKGRFYRPELDILRFVAFALVFLSHTIPLKDHSPLWVIALRRSCALGLPLFFALSAYLITELLLREKAVIGSIDIRSFYLRRIFRIWPLYFFALFGAFVLSRTWVGPAISLPALLAYLCLAGNWYSVAHGFIAIEAPLWSIAVEEQFYLLWPSVVRHASRRNIGIVSGLLWLLSQGVLLVLCSRGVVVAPGVWANSFTQLQYLSIGAAVSVIWNGSLPRIRPSVRIGMVLSGLAVFFAVTYCFKGELNDSSILTTYPEYSLAGVGVLLILVGFMGAPGLGRFSRLRYLGKISFGLYVFHQPCINLAVSLGQRVMRHNLTVMIAVVGFPLTVLCAVISYRYLETPFLRLKERFEVVPSRPL